MSKSDKKKLDQRKAAAAVSSAAAAIDDELSDIQISSGESTAGSGPPRRRQRNDDEGTATPVLLPPAPSGASGGGAASSSTLSANDDKFNILLAQMTQLNIGIAKINERLESNDGRLGGMDKKMDNIELNMDKKIEAINKRIDGMSSSSGPAGGGWPLPAAASSAPAAARAHGDLRGGTRPATAPTHGPSPSTTSAPATNPKRLWVKRLPFEMTTRAHHNIGAEILGQLPEDLSDKAEVASRFFGTSFVLIFKDADTAKSALQHFRKNGAYFTNYSEDKEFQNAVSVQPDRSHPARLQGRLLGYLFKKMQTHFADNGYHTEGYQLLQNGGRLHVVLRERTHELFGARPAADSGEIILTQHRDNLDWYTISEDIANTWMVEARAASGAL